MNFGEALSGSVECQAPRPRPAPSLPAPRPGRRGRGGVLNAETASPTGRLSAPGPVLGEAGEPGQGG